ncbi:MAG: acyltransferase [Bacilli bacterium]|nr:acyltransferase [Bacilli bacterium]
MNNYTKENLNYFYPLKFVASIIIAIFLHYNDHFLLSLGLPNYFNNKKVVFLMTETGVFVELFFIIAGVLFYVSTRKSILKKNNNFSSFFSGKISRLLPVIVVSSLYMFICNYALFKNNLPLWSRGTVSLYELLMSFFQGKIILSGQSSMNGPLWYIGIYIICLILAYYLTKKTKKHGDRVYLLPIFASLIIYYNFIKKIPMLNISLVRGLSSFFIGIFLGKFLILFNDFSKKKKFILKTICLLFLIFYLYCYHLNILNDFYSPISFSYSLFVFTPFIIFMYDFKKINKLFSPKIFKFLGNISYGIYVWNFPILITIHLLIIFGIIHPNVYSKVFFLILLVIHIIVAILSYYFIEQKCKNIKFNFIKKLLD